MSKWECDSGHSLEGIFYGPDAGERADGMPQLVCCPYCGSEMALSGQEGANELFRRIREFIGQVSLKLGPDTDGSRVIHDLDMLEVAVKKLASEVLRP